MLGAMFLLARPAPDAHVVQQVGVGLPRVNQWPRFWVSHSILFTGRRLNCTTIDADAPVLKECTMRLAGEPLVIRARPQPPNDPHQFGGTCKVFYGGEEENCSVTHGIYRTVHITNNLLTPQQLTLLRLRHPIENLRENVVFGGVFVASILTTLLASMAFIVWLWPQGNRWLFFLAVPLPAALIFVVTFIASLFVTAPFWD